MIKKYILYLLRWQASTPILAVFVWLFTERIGATATTILANFVGGLIFFWIDMLIFRKKDFISLGELWEVKPRETCADCGRIRRGYRLVISKDLNYDRSDDKKPQFRCQNCSTRKYLHIQGQTRSNLVPR